MYLRQSANEEKQDGKKLQEVIDEENIDKTGAAATVALVAKRIKERLEVGRVTNVDLAADGDTEVEIVVKRANVLPGIADRQLAKIKAINVALGGDPIEETVSDVLDGDLERITEVTDVRDLTTIPRIFERIPRPLAQHAYRYTIMVEGKDLPSGMRKDLEGSVDVDLE